MSIWTSSLRAATLALILPLAACMGEGTGGGLGFLTQPEDAQPEARPVLREAPLFRGNVVVAGPKGYCVDPQSLRRGSGGGFALVASCEVLSGVAGEVVDPVVMTVSVLPRRIGAEQPLAADLAGLVPEARVLDADDGDGVSLVRFSAGGDAALPEGDPKHWRGAMLINGHVVGLALYSANGSGVSGARGRALIMALAESLRSNSPVRSYSPDVSRLDTSLEEKPQQSGALRDELFPESN